VTLAAVLIALSFLVPAIEYIQACLSVSQMYPWVWQWKWEAIMVHIACKITWSATFMVGALAGLKGREFLATVMTSTLAVINVAIPTGFASTLHNTIKAPSMMETAILATSFLLFMEFAKRHDRTRTVQLAGTVLGIAIVIFALALLLIPPSRGGHVF
jgi:hypothetical protein